MEGELYAAVVTGGSIVFRGLGDQILTGHQFDFYLRGFNDIGSPIQITLYGAGPQNLGPHFCFSLDCAWKPAGPYRFISPLAVDEIPQEVGGYLDWGGYAMQLDSSIEAQPVVAPMVTSGPRFGEVSTYTYPRTPFSMTGSLTITRFGTVVVSEALIGAGEFSGTSTYYHGSTSSTSRYDFAAPEPSLAVPAGAALVWAIWRSRLQRPLI